MFTRNSEKDPSPAMPAVSDAVPPPAPPTHRPTGAAGTAAATNGGLTSSVIGRDLTIIGAGLKIVSRGLLQVDGDVQGDVIGLKIVIGQSGRVTGLVNAEEIIVQGAVHGTIKAVDVKLTASSIVEGDLYHQTFALEQGARFEGRSRRAATRDELLPDFSSLEQPDT